MNTFFQFYVLSENANKKPKNNLTLQNILQLPQEGEIVGNRFNYHIILSIPILAAKPTKYEVVQIAQH